MTDEKTAAIEDVLKLCATEDVAPAELDEVRAIGSVSDKIEIAAALQEDEPAKPIENADDPCGDIRTLISKMRLPEKVKLAMFGNSTARGLLIRDANKMVQLFVLKNPKLTLKEIEDFSKNPNLSDQVLRHISSVQAWVKSYTVKLHLVINPKTPGDLSLKWLKFLNTPDLKNIARSKNLPQIVTVAAKKRLSDLDKRK